MRRLSGSPTAAIGAASACVVLVLHAAGCTVGDLPADTVDAGGDVSSDVRGDTSDDAPGDASTDGPLDGADAAVDVADADATADAGCAADRKSCGGRCVTIADPTYGCTANSCASCGAAIAHTPSYSCAPGPGGCVANCETHWGDCYAADPGCETDLRADQANCGRCGKVCPNTTTCTDGICVAATCGDGTCQPPLEDCGTCPGDCTPANAQQICTDQGVWTSCGNGIVDTGETCSSCHVDAKCDPPKSCVQGACVVCGDGTCDEGEQTSCCQDCCAQGTCNSQGACVPTVACGDGICSPTESPATCCDDCACPSGSGGTCQNHVCVIASPTCGDGVCSATEDCTCSDCACVTGATCSGGACSCSTSDYWSKPSMSVTVTNPPYNVASLSFEIDDAHAGGALSFGVCKLTGTFLNDVYVEFRERVRYSGADLFVGAVSTANKPCSGPVPLPAAKSWATGQGLGGDVMIVSPSDCASTWEWGCNGGSYCGSCFFGSTSIITRTCK